MSETVISNGAIKDINRLSAGLSREVVALDALNEVPGLTPMQLAKLEDLLSHFAALHLEQTRKEDPAIVTAERIMDSLEVKDGFARLEIPAGIRETDAIDALNRYMWFVLQICQPVMAREALSTLETLPGIAHRDLSKERIIDIQPVVRDTKGLHLEEHEAMLKNAGMKLAAPEELALVAAAYRCKTGGKDILDGLLVWTQDGYVVSTSQKDGVWCRRENKYYCDSNNCAAAGVRS